jgi:maltoporin
LIAAEDAAKQATIAANAAIRAADAASEAASAARMARLRVVQLGASPSELPVGPPIQASEARQPSPIPSAAAAPHAPPAANPPANPPPLNFGFNGYVRSGFGQNNKGGDQVCFGLPGIAKYRLGNECTTYSELQGTVGFPVLASGIQAKYTVMLGYYDRASASAPGSEPAGFDVRQNWIGFTGFGGVLDGATVWGGRRYYQRHDVHEQDSFYWSQRGQGGGVENVTTPLGLFSVALMHTYNDIGSSAVPFTNGVSGNTLDVRLAKIPLNRNGTLELGADVRRASVQGDAQARGGFLLTAEHNQTGVLGGFNRFTLQYGQRAGANLATDDAGSYFFTTADTSSFRAIEQLLIEPNPDFSIFVVGTFQRTTKFRLNATSVGRRDWLSVGARPQWHWSDHVTTVLDVGYDQLGFSGDTTGPLSDQTARLLKVSFAPVVLKLGRKFFDRPELRFFGTCARWNRAADLLATESGNAPVNITGNTRYLGDRKGCSAGAQIEAWW